MVCLDENDEVEEGHALHLGGLERRLGAGSRPADGIRCFSAGMIASDMLCTWFCLMLAPPCTCIVKRPIFRRADHFTTCTTVLGLTKAEHEGP